MLVNAYLLQIRCQDQHVFTGIAQIDQTLQEVFDNWTWILLAVICV